MKNSPTGSYLPPIIKHTTKELCPSSLDIDSSYTISLSVCPIVHHIVMECSSSAQTSKDIFGINNIVEICLIF